MVNKTQKKLTLGFTVPELIVAITISTIMMAVLVTAIVAFTQQFSVSNVRQELNTDAQAAIARINEDIRNSIGIAAYNESPDVHAPATLVAPYDKVPGPEDAEGSEHNWRFGEGRLILVQPSKNATGETQYNDAATLDSYRNIIVYYVKDNVLYRRVIAGPGNATPTLTCGTQQGGCTTGAVTDTKILANLETSDGIGSFTVNYYDKSGAQIVAGEGTYDDYAKFSDAQLISVNLRLQRSQIGQALVEAKSAKTGFRVEAPDGVAAPITNLRAPIMVGPGGISNQGTFFSRQIITAGPITFYYGGFGNAANPMYINASNKYCGTGAAYATLYCTTSPISGYFANIYGDVCAANQTPLTGGIRGQILPGNLGTAYTKGLINPCTPQDVVLPTFDKAAFVGSMTSSQTKLPNFSTCNNSQRIDIEANTTYLAGHSGSSGFCKGEIKGNAYIKGDLRLGQGTVLKVSDSVGATPPTIVVNGSIRLGYGGTIQPNSLGTGAYIISFKSSNSTCSNSDTEADCLDNAQKETSTQQTAITLESNKGMPGIIFHAYHGEVNLPAGLTMCFNGTPCGMKVGGIIAQKLKIGFGASINTY